MRIIAFGHRKRVGKDSVCNLLKSQIYTYTNKTVDKAAFADKLYDIAHQLYGWDGQKTKAFYDAFGDTKEVVLPTIGKTPRQILIDLGTPAIRKQVYENTWVDYTLKTPRNVDVLLISDLRFPNEFEAVKNLGGLCIKVERDSVIPTSDLADNALQDETRWDFVIKNNEKLIDLKSNIWELVKEYIVC